MENEKMLIEIMLYNLLKAGYKNMLEYVIYELYTHSGELSKTLKLKIYTMKNSKKILNDIELMKDDSNFKIIDKDEFIFIANSDKAIKEYKLLD